MPAQLMVGEWRRRQGKKSKKNWGPFTDTPNTYQPSPLPFWQFTCPPVRQCCAGRRHFQKVQRSFYADQVSTHRISTVPPPRYSLRSPKLAMMWFAYESGLRSAEEVDAPILYRWCGPQSVGTGGRLAVSGRKAPRFHHRMQCAAPACQLTVVYQSNYDLGALVMCEEENQGVESPRRDYRSAGRLPRAHVGSLMRASAVGGQLVSASANRHPNGSILGREGKVGNDDDSQRTYEAVERD